MSLPELQILDHVGLPTFALRPDAAGLPVYAFWNRACERASQRPRAEILGRTALDIYDESLGRAAYDLHCDVLQNAREISYDILLDLGGDVKEVHTTLSPVLDKDGQVITLVGTSRVIDGLRRAQKNELETLALVEQTRNEMERFISFAAHDLRSPMRNVAGLIDAMRDEIGPDQSQVLSLIDMLEELSKKTLRQISDVLNFSQSHNAQPELQDFEFSAMSRDIFSVLDPHQQHDLQADTAWLHGDKVAIQIVLRNLVDNAIKYGQRECITVRAKIAADENGLKIVIWDNGPGLPQEDQAFLDGGKFRYETGFGLLGIRRLVQLRQGTLTASKRPEGGTIFQVFLPGTALIEGPDSARSDVA